MGKFLVRIIFLILITIGISVIYLSYIGINTDKFDYIIKSKANEVNKNIKLDFKETKIHLNLKELNLVVKLQNPKILIKNNQIDLSKLDLFLTLRSFFTSDFLLKRAEIAFKENDIKDLTKITNSFLPKIINSQFKKIFTKGKLEGEFIIPFHPNGKIDEGYGFSGKIQNAEINITQEFSIKDLTTEITHLKIKGKDAFKINIKKGLIYDLKLDGSEINIMRDKNNTEVSSLIHTNGKLNFFQIKKIASFLGVNIKDFKEINGTSDLKTNINFNLDNRFRLKNPKYSVEGDISSIEIHTENRTLIKKYLPEFDPIIKLKNTNIKIVNSKSEFKADFIGLIKVKENFDNFKLTNIYKRNKKDINLNGSVELTNSKIKILALNFDKDEGEESEINFDFNFYPNKYFNIKKLDFFTNKSKINLININLNKDFEIEDFKKIEIKTYRNKVKNNDFLAEKSNEIKIFGDLFDVQPILKNIYKKSDKNTFSKNFNSNIKINFNKTLTGTNDDIINFSMIASIKKGSYEKLSLKGNFSENEFVEMSIYQLDSDKKTLQVISDRARPFVKNFDFIKGFEEGKLEYESIISKGLSNSTLVITDFKVSKVPALAKLLTLASLQGIADTLSGEGIRFESFEMKTNSKDNILNIEDALAMGPAVSILLDGYVDKGKIVSLRGTLVPATKLNSIIASIPVVGEILVGKKTGEGVVGVSFKMKGPPKNIKTSVNPIKTLTPRFIVRAVEKMKKKKKEESK